MNKKSSNKTDNKNKQGNDNGVLHSDLIDKISRSSDQSKYKIKKSTITSDEELTTFIIDTSFSNKPNTSGYSSILGYSANNRESSISTSTKNQIKTESNKCWIPKQKSITIAGIKIDRGMIYVGSKLQSQSAYGGQDNCLINPRLKVSNNSNGYNDGKMSYWPSYSDISAQNRRKYLEWLADGAKNPDIDTGYVFLYFYGLERRLFLDQSIKDAVDIRNEIKRLLLIYNSNHSINNYLSEALSCADLLIQKEQPKPTVKISDSYNWEIPLNIRFYLGKKLQNNPILNIDDLLIWFFNHPEKRLRTPARRLNKEFIALMKIRLTEKYPDGLKVRIPKKKLSPSYTASSNNFTVNLSRFIDDIPDISSINAPIKKIQNVANGAMDELDKLSRLIGRNPKDIGTFKALALLPPELTKEFGGDMANEIQLWISEKHQSQSGITILELVKKITDYSGAKITKAIHKEVEQVLTSLGWNVIPAHNEIMGSIKPDMKILLLPQDNDSRAIESPSQEFLLALFELTLGAYIAHANHHVLPEEMDILSKRIEVLSHLKKSEHNRLYLYIRWLAIQKVELLTLKNKLKNLNKDSKMAFADIAISVAAADGKIIPQKVKALETVYQSMGLDKKELFSSLHSMTKSGVHKSIDKTSKPLGVDANPLNMERIASTLHDTAKASTLLASIFEDDEIELEPKKVNENIDENTIYAGLDKVHAQLLNELLKKDEWSRDEYQKLASSLKLMPDGAIEVINEWAFEVCDEIIIENDDPMIIYKELINKAYNNEQ
jgi:tellurite resistance protein